MAVQKNVIAVCAATGLQGECSSVAEHFLAHPDRYRVRALVRNLDAPVAKELQQKGAELHLATLNDLGSLCKAFQGVDAVFGYTTPQPVKADSASEVNETHLGKNIVDACRRQGVKWLVWTSCPSAQKYSGGKYQVPTYDEKTAVDDYIRATGLPATILMLGGFLENLLTMARLQEPQAPVEDLEYHTAIIPTEHAVPWVSVRHDLGPITECVFANALGWDSRPANPDKWWHREVNACFRWGTGVCMKEAIEAASGRGVRNIVASKEQSLESGPHMAALVPLLEFARDFITMPDPDDATKHMPLPDRSLTEEGLQLDTLERWVRKDLIPTLRFVGKRREGADTC